MMRWFGVMVLSCAAQAHVPSPVVVEIVGADGRTFREIPMNTRDGSVRSYLQAEKGARYEDSYAGWRANLDAINEFYFADWQESYAEAFGDRSARGVIAVAVYREVPPPTPVHQPYRGAEDARSPEGAPAASGAPADRVLEKSARRDESAGTGYGERRVDHVVEVEFVAQRHAESRHFIKYEWRETLCRKQVLDCGEPNRFWDESALGFAPPPPRRR
jgi:hypothetical protein